MNQTQTTNTDDIRRAFKTLATDAADRIVRKGVNAGGDEVLLAAQIEVPVDEGDLEESLGKKTKVYKDTGTGVSVIGSRRGGDFKGYHHHLVHNGHIAADGSFVPGNPYLKRARDRADSRAKAAMASTVNAELQKEAARA
ncbi:MAG: HK97 gp10 family phage protein [Planctomycetota bacterium]